MISALTGELTRVGDDRVNITVGPFTLDMLVTAADVRQLSASIGKEMTFQTIMYIEGDASGGSLEPRLIGFLNEQDKAFFQLFITVKGIGPKKALKALVLPATEIAQAIENKNSRFLVELPQIGKRMAEQIVAELSGKCGRFMGLTPGPKGATSLAPSRAPAEEDALSALMALGERRGDAEALLDRAKKTSPDLKTTDAFVREMLRLRVNR